MREPAQNLIHRLNAGPFGHGGAVDHDYRQVQLARSVKLGARASTAGVFCDDMGHLVGAHQVKITFQREGAARHKHAALGQGQGVDRRIDKAQNVMMLGTCSKVLKVLATDREKDPGRIARQAGDGGGYVGHRGPAILGRGAPGFALQCQQGQAGQTCGLHRVAAHLGGEGMGRVDDMGDRLGLQPGHEAADAAETTDAGGQGLGLGRLGSTGVREDGRNPLIRQGFRHGRGFGGAAKQKDAGHG